MDSLRRQLEEAQETLRAITAGEVDALVVAGPAGDQVFTLKDADRPYRHLAEQMQEGACTLNAEGIILFTNSFFAQLLRVPTERIMGTPFAHWVCPEAHPHFAQLLQQSLTGTAMGEIDLVAPTGDSLPVHLSLSLLKADEGPRITCVVFDLRERQRNEQALRRMNQELEQRVLERTAQLRAANEELKVANEELEVANEEQKVANEELADANRHLADEIAERKRGEALIQSLATIPAENPNPVLRLTAAGLLLYANPASAPVLANWNASVGNTAPEFWRKLVADAYANQAARTIDVPIADRIYAFSVAPIAETGYVNLYGRDITATIRAQESLREALQALQQAEQKANDLIRYAPTAIYEIDFRGPRFTRVNDAMCQMSGYTRQELLAMSPFALLDPDSQKRFQERIRKTLAGEPIDETVEYRAIVKDGRELYTTLQTRLLHEGGKAIGAFVIGHDVTERKHSEQQLRESEQRYRRIIETANEGIAIHEPDGTITYVNQRMADLLGYSCEEMIGKSNLDFVDNEERAAVIRARESVKEQGSFSKERKLRRKDGSILWTLANVSPRRDGAGNYLGYLAMHTDITERKRMEEALRRSEEQYRDLVESSNSIIMRADEHLNITYMNPFGLAYFGYTAEELIGKNVMGTTIPMQDNTGRDLSAMVQDIKQNPDKYKTNLHQNMRKNGELVWVSWTNKVTYDRDGKFVDILAIGNDIDQIRKAEEAKRQSEALLQAVLDGTPDPVYVKDRTSRILLANQALAQVVGKPLEQIIGRTDSEYYANAAVGQALRENDLQIMESGTSAVFEETINTPDGECTFLSSKAPYRTSSGEIIGIIGISRDITQRKEMEDALRQATRQAENHRRVLEAVIQQMPAGVILTDATGTVARNNKAMDRIWRREMLPTENVDEHGYVAFHPDGSEYRPEDWPLTRSLRAGEEIIGEEMVILRGDGTKGTVYVSSAPIRDDEDKIIAGVVIDVDISELKQAEDLIHRLNRQLEQRAQELEMANKELESFSYSVSHDLRAPLASINGFANLLLQEQGTALPDDARRLVDLIQKNSAEMSQLVDGLLRLSRSIRQPLTKQTVDLDALAHQVVDDLNAQAGRHVDVLFSTLPPAQADPVLLKQVLTNLLSNALKFTRQREVAKIDIGSSMNVAGEIVYHIRDNGVGFDAAHAAGLFGAFQRFHSEEDYEGTGIGLAVVERIIRRHGGRVWAEAEVDQGATFFFTLPT